MWRMCSYSACKLFYITLSHLFHTLPWWAVQRSRSSSRKRGTIVLVVRCFKCPFRNFARLRGLMLKSSPGWVYMQAVRVCLCMEISGRCSMGSVLDTQLMGVPWPTLAHCHHAGIILFCGDHGDHGAAGGSLSIIFQMASLTSRRSASKIRVCPKVLS